MEKLLLWILKMKILLQWIPFCLLFQGLSQKVCKVREDGEYPAKTLYEIVLCIQFHLETLGFAYKIISDDKFKDVKFVLDNTMKDRTARGIGNEKKQANILTELHEDILWDMGVVGLKHPSATSKCCISSYRNGSCIACWKRAS